jgi:hypothetical protein
MPHRAALSLTLPFGHVWRHVVRAGAARASEEEPPAVQAQAEFCQVVHVVVNEDDAGYVGGVFGDLSAYAAEAESGRAVGFARDDARLDQTPSVPRPVRALPE